MILKILEDLFVLTNSNVTGPWEDILRVLAQCPVRAGDAPNQPKKIHQGKGRGYGIKRKIISIMAGKGKIIFFYQGKGSDFD